MTPHPDIRAALVEPPPCTKCQGAGTVRSMTSHLGPDDYEFDEDCPACQGTGSADLRDAINALGHWDHKTDIHRTLIERSAVLRIIDARAALSASPEEARAVSASAERPISDERDAFEKWVVALPYWAVNSKEWAFERSPGFPNMYMNQRLDDMWKGWQARARASMASPPAGEGR